MGKVFHGCWREGRVGVLLGQISWQLGDRAQTFWTLESSGVLFGQRFELCKRRCSFKANWLNSEHPGGLSREIGTTFEHMVALFSHLVEL